jgi:hypothetical protein
VALAWGATLPSGVQFDITAVHVEDATLEPFGCLDKPPCLGWSQSGGTQAGCAVALTPASPETETVWFRLDGILRCPDEPSCEGVNTTGISSSPLTIPTPSPSSSEDSESDDPEPPPLPGSDTDLPTPGPVLGNSDSSGPAPPSPGHPDVDRRSLT